MAHFAEINNENIVTRVLVTDNALPNEGQDWLEANIGGTWVKTSYNTFAGIHQLGGTPLRKNFAGIGYSYRADLDAFVPPKPFPSWILNLETCLWDAPSPKPAGSFTWDESTLSWVEA